MHRIGRTARAGASGAAISFCDPSERGYLRDIERLTDVKITVLGVQPDGLEETATTAPARGRKRAPNAANAAAAPRRRTRRRKRAA